MDKAYIELENTYKRVKQLSNIQKILNWDTAVMLPKGSIESRAEQIATLNSMSYELLSTPKTLDLIHTVDITLLNDWEKANFKQMKKLHHETIAVDQKLKEEYTIACVKSEMAWRSAKLASDYKIFLPHLKEVLNLTKKIASSKASFFDCSPYDALLQTYEPNLTTQTIDSIFNNLSNFLPDFTDKVIQRQSKDFASLKSQSIPLILDLQKTIGLECMKLLGFCFNRGRLDTSDHPFCGGISQDVRITTKYNETDFLSGLMAIIHETGHALYEQNLPNQWVNQPIGSILGMATHESQSLIYEYQLSRSKGFITFLSKLLIDKFALDKNIFSSNKLHSLVNKVQPSFIRIESDEVTYPAHIILRYNLEKALINNELEPEDLPHAWNEYMHKILGIKPSLDSEGCLQDIHWSLGLFGYFPCYLIGAIMASQLYNQINNTFPNHVELIENGNFKHMNTWLNKNIHQHGSFYEMQNLLIKSTNQTLNIEIYKNYLKNKFLE